MNDIVQNKLLEDYPEVVKWAKNVAKTVLPLDGRQTQKYIFFFGIYGSSRSYNTGARFKVHGGFWQEGEAHYLVQLGLSPKCCLGVPLVLKLGMFDIHVTCKDMAKHGIAFDGMTWHLMA